MATSALKGSADFLYTPSGGSPTVHTLAVPLLVSPRYSFENRRLRRTFEAWSADGTSREVFNVGTAVDEISGKIRFENEPSSLRSMLQEGLENDVTLTYRPTGSGGDTYPAKLVSAGGGPGEVVVRPDPDRWGFGEFAVSIVLRRVDGGDFEGLL